jgi:hypothetical protein
VLAETDAPALTPDSLETRRRHQGVPPHFQGEQGDAGAVLHSGVAGDIEGQAGLAHAGAPGDDDEVRALEPGEELVQAGEAGGDVGQALGGFPEEAGAASKYLSST